MKAAAKRAAFWLLGSKPRFINSFEYIPLINPGFYQVIGQLSYLEGLTKTSTGEAHGSPVHGSRVDMGPDWQSGLPDWE